MSSKAAEIEIERIYECLNTDCSCVVKYTQKAFDDFKKTCPICGEDELVIRSGKCSLSFQTDVNTPKTLGVLAEKNAEQREKDGLLPPKQEYKPWWRKGKDKVDFDVLRNPKKYVLEGKK